MKRLVCTLVCLVLGGAALAGPVYKGVDENGQTYFSDRPINAKTEKVVEVRYAKAATPAPAAVDAGKPEGKAEPSAKANVDRAEARRKANELSRNELARYAENCSMSKVALGEIESKPRLYKVLEDGSRRYYSARERQALLDTAKADVERWCNPA